MPATRVYTSHLERIEESLAGGTSTQTMNGGFEALGDTKLSGRLGFFGATATTRPTVTGSKGANAALTSLISALATLGLITDSTS